MKRLVIEGGRRLSGRVPISGAKNSVLKLLAASLMTSETCTFRNVPRLADVDEMVRLLRQLGAEVSTPDDGVIQVKAERLHYEAPEETARKLRASVQVMGPLLARLGRSRVALPGGCNLGPRPIDLHLAGLEALGARFREEYGFIDGRADQLQGTSIYLDQPSVGATENIMMAATLAKGTTYIHNAAREPEVSDVAHALVKMGAKIGGIGTGTIRIDGVARLGGCDYTVLPDRIEAGTFLAIGALVGDDVRVAPVVEDHLEAVIAKLRQMGARVEIAGNEARVQAPPRLKGVRVETQPFPGFPTDMQPQITALLAVAEGIGVVKETVYTSRFKYVDELRRMGADITIEGNVAVVKGRPQLTGTRVVAPDLRAGAALAIAALGAAGTTEIEGVEHIDRGYENLAEKLRSLGARVTLLEG